MGRSLSLAHVARLEAGEVLAPDVDGLLADLVLRRGCGHGRPVCFPQDLDHLLLYGRPPGCKRLVLWPTRSSCSLISGLLLQALSCLLALMEFAERRLIFGASLKLQNRCRLYLSRSNLFSHHPLRAA